MRISTSQIYERGAAGIIEQQQRLLKLQTQLVTNKKVQSPSDDPLASAQIELMNQRISNTELMQKNRQTVESALSIEEDILSGSVNAIIRLRDAQVQAGDPALSDADRKALVVVAQGMLDQLQDYANSKDLNGNYMFSGGKSSQEAITQDAAGKYIYNGDSTQRFQAVADNLQIAVNDTGDKVFMAVPAAKGTLVTGAGSANTGSAQSSYVFMNDSAAFVPGNYTITFAGTSPAPQTYSVVKSGTPPTTVQSGSYTDGDNISFNGMQMTVSGTPDDGDTLTVKSVETESVFATVQRMIDNLNTPVGSSSTDTQKNMVKAINGQMLQQFDKALDHLLISQADVGSRLNQLDSVDTVNADLLLTSSEVLKQLSEIDPNKVAVEYQLQLINLQAAQQTFVKIQNLSVFNYI